MKIVLRRFLLVAICAILAFGTVSAAAYARRAIHPLPTAKKAVRTTTTKKAITTTTTVAPTTTTTTNPPVTTTTTTITTTTTTPTTIAPIDAGFVENFNKEYTLSEAGSLDENADPNWWLSSGGLFYYANGVAQTVQGELSKGSYWQIEYANSNPQDTDNGYHPQNIFRLVTLSEWQNLDQEVSLKIVKDNLSSSENRNCSNGCLLYTSPSPRDRTRSRMPSSA
jgi:hypothetical protein